MTGTGGAFAGGAGGGISDGAGGAFGGGGPGVDCDLAGACGDYSRGCTGCAVLGACKEAYDGCFSDAECLDLNVCLSSCADNLECKSDCAKKYPSGTERYNTLVRCVVCEACPVSCESFSAICP